MDERISEITLAVEGTVTITTAEYHELIASQTMLDMMLESARRDGGSYATPNHALVDVALHQRQLYRPYLTISKESGDGDA